MAVSPRSGDRVSGDVESPCRKAEAQTSGSGRSLTARASAPPLSQIELTPAERYASRQSETTPLTFDAKLTRYGRMIRPFPVRGLSDALYHVLGDAATIQHILTGVQIDPPQLAETWCEALYNLDDVLVSLSERAQAARSKLEEFIDRSDADEARGLSALRALTEATVSEPIDEREPEPFREPAPCPVCGGHGGSVSDGNCDHCSGTGIDPEDPASPL